MYIKDAARATLQLAAAPVEHIKMVNYLIDGVTPTPSVEQLAATVRERVPSAQIDFQLDPELQAILDHALRPVDGSRAAEEWGWQPSYDLEGIVDDFIEEMKKYPERYV